MFFYFFFFFFFFFFFLFFVFFFFNDTATTEIYTLSLHDALPIFDDVVGGDGADRDRRARRTVHRVRRGGRRSERVAGVEIGRAHV